MPGWALKTLQIQGKYVGLEWCDASCAARVDFWRADAWCVDSWRVDFWNASCSPIVNSSLRSSSSPSPSSSVGGR
ncbi:hypothetical protein BRAS3843_680041 [Bradyrhizobium sp. STM 3843]|nr:hypothetical protein BRAS3843_680041 [Bradyrhizobium sp. STM 3843]